jgi:hypothetical protein
VPPGALKLRAERHLKTATYALLIGSRALRLAISTVSLGPSHFEVELRSANPNAAFSKSSCSKWMLR